jgi:hypothetical protein
MRPPPERPKFAEPAKPRERRPVAPAVSAAPPLPVMPDSVLPPPEPDAARQPQAITQTTPPPDPFALPAKPEDNAKERALKSAAAIDRQMRKEAWNPRDKKIANDTTALAAAIGRAYVGGSGAMEEVTMADGTRMTKWRMPGGGTACFYKESNGFSGGRDPFRDTGKIKVMSCP